MTRSTLTRRWLQGPGWIGALVLGLVMALAMSTPASANHIPNTSIVFYKPTSTTTGKAQFGTLANGALTLKGSLSTGKWTHVAVSRDTLMFYNSGNGKIMTGTFFNGIFAKKGGLTIGKGWKRVAASCDSVAFYNGTTGTLSVWHLQGGTMFGRTDYFNMNPLDGGSYDLITSSCDTIQLWRNHSPGFSAYIGYGILQNGQYRPSGASDTSVTHLFTHQTATADSFLWYARGDRFGVWGQASGGSLVTTGSAKTFGNWPQVAGTGDSVLFYYPPTGEAARVTLQNGVYNYWGNTFISPGWKLIAGGR